MPDEGQFIQEAIDFIHMNEEARNAYMTIGMKIAEERREAKLEGRAEGKAEERSECIRNMLNSGKTPEQISEFCGFPIQEVMEVKSKCESQS